MITASAEWANFWVQVVYTLVTLGILVVALRGDLIRGRFFGPRLKVTLADASGSLTTRNDRSRVRYFHLRIKNENPRVAARSVKVLCTHWAKGPAGASLTPKELPIPLQFMWSFPQYRGLTPTIVSDDRADLGHVDEGSGSFLFDFYIKPNNVDTSVKANETAELIIRVEAENYASAPSIRLRVTWDGQWPDDDQTIAGHLVLTQL